MAVTPALAALAVAVAVGATAWLAIAPPGARRARARVVAGPQRGPSRRAPVWVERALDDAGWSSARRWWPHWLGAAAGSLLAMPAVPAGPLVAAVVVAGPPLAVWSRRGTARRSQIQALPDLLEATASGVRSGAHLRGALADAGRRVEPWSDAIATTLTDDVPLVEGLGAWRDDPHPAVRLAGAALSTAATVGGPGARALSATAQSLRSRADVDDAVDALSAQARLSARLLTAAPVGFAVVLAGVAPSALGVLFASPAGWACLLAGLALDVLGAAWMHRLVREAR